jgi:hypothetical protein
MPTAQTVSRCDEMPIHLADWAEPFDYPARWTDLADESPNPEHVARQLSAEMKRAKQVLELGYDWDGEGSEGYSEDTLNRAITFLNTHVKGLWDSYGRSSPIPKIGPGPDGSIDLHWSERSWELLVNIPVDPNAMATFYGDDYGAQKIRGTLYQTRFNQKIASWLMQ